VTDASELVAKLHGHTWTLCTGFRLGAYLFLNDATHEDGAAEFAVVNDLGGGQYRQIESWTVSWMQPETLAQNVDNCLAGKLDDCDWAHSVTPTLQTPQEHGRCRHCARSVAALPGHESATLCDGCSGTTAPPFTVSRPPSGVPFMPTSESSPMQRRRANGRANQLSDAEKFLLWRELQAIHTELVTEGPALSTSPRA
jgi:hypothetical protein